MDENIRMVQEIYAAYHRGDVAGVLSHFHPEVQMYQTEELPWGGEHRGLEGVGRFLSILTQTIESAVEVESLYAAGDRVVQIGRTRGRVRSTGVPFDVRAVHVWRLREGKVIGYEAYVDTPAMLQALRGEELARAFRSGTTVQAVASRR